MQQVQIGSNVTVQLGNQLLTGVVIGVGTHKGRECADIRIPGERYERFFYAHQLISINKG